MYYGYFTKFENKGNSSASKFMTKNRTPTERQLNKLRIAKDKARVTRWASRRRSQRKQDLPVASYKIY